MQVDLHREELPLGFGQELEVTVKEQHDADRRSAAQEQPDDEGMVKTSGQSFLIARLQPGEETILDAFHSVQFIGFAQTDKTEREERCHPGRVENTGDEGIEDRPWEILDKFTQRSRDDAGHGEEHTAYRHCGEGHRHE